MFFSRLEACCIQRGIKPSALADEFHTTRSVISGWKHGASPNSEFVTLAAKYFSVSSDYLLGLSDDPRPSTNQADIGSIDPSLAASLIASPVFVRNSVLRIAKVAFDELLSSSMSAADAPVFSSQIGPIPAHSSGKIRPYPKQLQGYGTSSQAKSLKDVQGKVAAGPPITTVPADDQRLMVPLKYTGEQYFIVQVEGDSMMGVVSDGDFCVLNKYGHYDDGHIVLVQVDGPTDQPDATLKRIYRRSGERVELRSENRKYPPMFYPAEEVVVMGELVAVLRPDAPVCPRP